MSIHLLREVEKLKKRVLTLGALVEEQVRKSVEAAVKRDEKLAAEVIAADMEIDRMEVDIEEECLKLLALYQAVAGDLRFIVAILKMNSDLERIGDLAVNIAERAQFLANLEPDEMPFDLRGMAEKAQAMLKKSLDALVNRDVALAYRVCAADEEVDNVNRQAYAVLMEAVQKSPAAAQDAHPPVHRAAPARAHRRPRHQHRRGRDLHAPGRDRPPPRGKILAPRAAAAAETMTSACAFINADQPRR